jgi:hypothetical protein
MYDFVAVKGGDNSKLLTHVSNVINHVLTEGDVALTISKAKKTKTSQQRKYAHYVIAEIAKYCGYKPEDLKFDIKVRLGLIYEYETDGSIITKEISTEKLKRDEYGIFITEALNIARFVSEPESPLKLKQPKFFGMDLNEIQKG